jgi:molybdopterin converting factor subunit 1
MKHIRVRWFAAFREATGTTEETVSTEAESAGALFDQLKGEYSTLRSREGAMVAINDSISNWDAEVKDGDEVLFFPPVAGG